MNKIIKDIVIGVIAVVALGAAVVAYNKTPSVVSTHGDQGIQGAKGERGAQGPQGPQGVTGPAGRSFSIKDIPAGAVATLDNVDNPYTKIGGVARYNYNRPIMATSSVFCSIQNPLNATSTLLYYHVNTTANGLGTQTFDISTSSTALGSSSPAFVKNFSTGSGQFNTVWIANGTTTNALLIGTAQGAVGQSNVVIGPTDYVTAKISTSTAGTFGSYFSGQCGGVFEKL